MKQQLPPHIFQRLDTFVMTYSDDYSEVANEALAVPIEYIRWDYPVRSGGSMQLHKLEKPVANVHDLLREVKKYLRKDYDNDLCTAPHVFEDYCTEIIDIHPGNLATVYFGS